MVGVARALSQKPAAVKARAIRARRSVRAAPVVQTPPDNSIAELKAMMAGLAEQNKVLAEQMLKLQAAPKLPTTSGPEKKLQDFIKSMRPGEQRDGIREVRDSDIVAMDGAFKSGDIVSIRPETPRAIAWRKALKDEGPIYGQVLQYLGRTENKRGPRKYKVHFNGIGRDGVTEDEVEFVKSA